MRLKRERALGKEAPRDLRKAATVVDLNVAARIKAARREAGISQTKLAQGVGVTFQQVQKYENGANRVSADRLQRIAEVVHKPVSYFFLDQPPAARGGVELLAAVVECMKSNPDAVRILKSLPRLNLRDTKMVAEFVERLTVTELTR